MTGLLHILLSFPTAVFTVLMVVVVLYWLLVIPGALHVDIFQGGDHAGGAADGAAEGAAEGAADGALEGAGDGAADGIAEGTGHGVGEGAAEAHGHDLGDGHGHDVGDADGHELGDGDHGHGGGLSSVLHALGLRSAPLTVVVSLIIFYSWVLLIAAGFGGGQLARLMPLWLLNTALVVLALVLAIWLASFTSRPLGRVFVVKQAPRRASLVGHVCTVTTGRVDSDFGQAEYDDGGAGMVLQIRCDRPGQFQRGDRALIIDFDNTREAFLVEPAGLVGAGDPGKSGRGQAA